MQRAANSGDQRRQQLDSLRLIAILGVLFDHSGVSASFVPGQAGVRFFLLLSGFLITRTLLRHASATWAESKPALLAFYGKRALRIWPLYYAMLAVLLATGAIKAREALMHGLFLTNIVQAIQNHWHVPSWFMPHVWTICVQEQFYLIWPPLFVLLGRVRRIGMLLAMLALAVLFRAGMWLAGLDSQIGFYTLPIASFDALAVGSLLAIGHARIGPLIDRRVQAAAVALAVALSLAGFLTGFVPVVVLPSLWLIPLGVLILSAFDGRLGRLGQLLDWPPLVFLGRISLGIYLLHLPVAMLIIETSPRWVVPLVEHRTWTGLAINTTVTIVLAVISWLAFERPLQGLRRYLPDGRGKAA